MQARELMSHPAVTVTPGTTAAGAAALLCDHGFTALPVVEHGELVGIVTEADLIGAGDHSGTLVGEVMTAPVESLTPTADRADIVRIMHDARIRCLPVVEGLRVIGVVTRRDLLRTDLEPTDEELAEEIDRQLAALDTPNRWRVSVTAGVADIEDFGTDTTSRDRAARLASTVPGVVEVRAHHQTPDPF